MTNAPATQADIRQLSVQRFPALVDQYGRNYAASSTHQLLQRFADTPYKAASNIRRAGALWNVWGGSANSDYVPSMETLRARSRACVRNNLAAAGAIQTLVDNVIGQGLRVRPTVDRTFLGLSEEQSDDLKRAMSREMYTWGHSEECDLEALNNFVGLQQLAFRSAMESGDCLTLLPFFSRGLTPYRTRVQLVESDRVSNPPRIPINVRSLIAGVELDANGAPAFYHVQSTHPGDANFQLGMSAPYWDRVRAWSADRSRRNAWLVYRTLRIGQSRGVPYLATALEPLKQLERYGDAELMAAVVGGMFTVFVKSGTGEGGVPVAAMPFEDNTGNLVSGKTASDLYLDYGLIADLGQDESIEVANPGRPNRAYGEFVRSIMEQIGSGLGIPFELLIKHFTSSYSASRGALLEAWKFFDYMRDWFVKNFCQPIYETIMAEAVALGRLNLPGFFESYDIRKAYLKAEWIGPTMGLMNPVQEVEAAQMRVNMEISTLDRETMQLTGQDWYEIHAQRKREITLQQQDGTGKQPDTAQQQANFQKPPQPSPLDF